MTIYYTYCSYETDKGDAGLMYIGYRKCPKNKTPWTDDGYYGTQRSKKNQDFKNNPNKSKFILGVFDNAEAAIAHEVELHEANNVGANPEFANQAKQTSTGFSMSGKEHSQESRYKMSESHSGVSLAKEHCFKIAESQRGKKRGSYNSGSENPMYGKEHSPETCQKISEGKKGEKNPMFGKNHSPETILKMSGPRPSMKGERNWKFDRNLYDFENKELGIVERQVTRCHLWTKYHLQSGNLGKVTRGEYRKHKGWALLDPN